MHRRLPSGAIAVLLAFFPSISLAQSVRGTILGTVTDATGAVVRGAKVTATQTATGLTRTETDERCRGVCDSAASGGELYDRGGRAGVQDHGQDGIELRVDDRLRIDIALSVGQVSDTVAVEATAPVINTDSSTLGNVVDNKKVTELPLNGRNFLQLNLLVPGVNQGVKGSQNQTQGGSISVNGAREQANNFLLDGMDNNDLAINQYAVAISTEAIQEFKVQTSTYSAEFGRSPGAQINVATKAGRTRSTGWCMSICATTIWTRRTSSTGRGRFRGISATSSGRRLVGRSRRTRRFTSGIMKGTRVRQGLRKSRPSRLSR